ncbi:hypothetical protein B0T22DRAFT_62816 [Podospora appendiculata]|uniref:Uncharacterized protein n=1 Tax=Podospora appendiculata TaxID=314037 RepID=A0AAE1CHB2_9PEZI|nr:hypothetical protein B0T22DRAFT_62816 [Podospora appendiculata]
MALVLVPCDSVAEFLMTAVDTPTAALAESPCRANGGLHDIIRYYADQCLASTSWDHLLPVFKEICTKTWQMNPTERLAGLPPTLVQSILQASLHARDWDFFEQTASHICNKLPLTFFQWARAEVKAGRLAFCDVGKGMMTAAVSYADAHRKCLAVLSLVDSQDDAVAQEGARQAAATICGMSHPKPLGERDGRMLVEMASVVLGLECLVSTGFVPVVEINSAQVPFMFGVIRELRMSEYRTDSQSTITRSLLQKLARQTISALDVSRLPSINKSTVSHRLKQGVASVLVGPVASPRLASQAPLEATTEAQHIADFIDCLLAEKMDDILTLQSAFKIVGGAELINKREFVLFGYPSFACFRVFSKKHGVPLSTPRYRHIFAAILDSYILKLVGREPARDLIPPAGQPPLSSFCSSYCGYSICQYASRFLASPSQSFALRASQQQMAHLSEHCSLSLKESLGFTFACEDDDRVVLRKPKPLTTGDSWGDWTQRKAKARRQISLISSKLPEILGEEYHGIIELKSLDIHSSLFAENDAHPQSSSGTGVAYQQKAVQRSSQQPFAQFGLPPASHGNPFAAGAVPLPPISSLHLPVPSHSYAHNTFTNVGSRLPQQTLGVGQPIPVTRIAQQSLASVAQQQAHVYPGSTLSAMGTRLTHQPLGVSQPSPVARPPQQSTASANSVTEPFSYQQHAQ